MFSPLWSQTWEAELVRRSLNPCFMATSLLAPTGREDLLRAGRGVLPPLCSLPAPPAPLLAFCRSFPSSPPALQCARRSWPSDRFGKSGRRSRDGGGYSWASRVWPEIACNAASKVLGSFSSRPPEDVSPGLPSAAGTVPRIGSAAWCPQPWRGGRCWRRAGVVVLGLSSRGGKDASTCLLFPVADGRLRGPAPGGSGEKGASALPPRLVVWSSVLCSH